VSVSVSLTRGFALPGSQVGVHVSGEHDRGVGRKVRFAIELHVIDTEARRVRLLEQAVVLSDVPAPYLRHADGERADVRWAELFMARLPEDAPAYYRLQAIVGEAGSTHRRTEFITVIEQCLDAVVTVGPASVKPGAELSYTVENRGPGPVLVGTEYRVARLDDGRWTDGPPVDRAFAAVAHVVGPGARRPFTMHVPDAAPAGRYRVITRVDAVGTPLARDISGDFEISV
jgi:hypothetical protein